MLHQAIRRAVRQGLILTTLTSVAVSSFCQELDTSKLIRVIEKELKRQGLPNAKFDLNVKSHNQSGGQTAFQITNQYSANSHVINGVNYGINGDVNFLSEKYALMAQLDLDGSQFRGVGIVVNSELSILMKKVVFQPNDTIFSVIFKKETLKYADEVIEKYPYFPFAYWAKSALLSYYGDIRWVEFAEKAVDILNHTSRIGGHLGIHDKILKSLNQSLQQYHTNKK